LCAQPYLLAPAFSLFLITSTLVETPQNDPLWYFLNMFLALYVAEALALLVSQVVPHFIIGIALLAGIYGFFMLFQGFMIIPSAMPGWLEWVSERADIADVSTTSCYGCDLLTLLCLHFLCHR